MIEEPIEFKSKKVKLFRKNGAYIKPNLKIWDQAENMKKL
jgi:hypothetical protein